MASSVPPSLLAVAIGGAAGATLRHAVNHWLAAAAPDHPYAATFAVNVAGSLLLGAILGLVVARPDRLPAPLELGLTVGLLGALTTYSTFATDAVKLIDAGRLAWAAAYVLTTTAAALTAAGAAFWIVRAALAHDSTP